SQLKSPYLRRIAGLADCPQRSDRQSINRPTIRPMRSRRSTNGGRRSALAAEQLELNELACLGHRLAGADYRPHELRRDVQRFQLHEGVDRQVAVADLPIALDELRRDVKRPHLDEAVAGHVGVADAREACD